MLYWHVGWTLKDKYQWSLCAVNEHVTHLREQAMPFCLEEWWNVTTTIIVLWYVKCVKYALEISGPKAKYLSKVNILDILKIRNVINKWT